jgi:DDE superfamily endonuclease
LGVKAAFAGSCRSTKSNLIPAKAVMNSLEDQARAEAIERLSQFRRSFYQSLERRADALFELAEAVLCADGPVSSLVALSLCPEFRRGHGGLYDALAAGRIAAEPLQDALIATLPQGTPLLFAVDVTPYPRPDAECSAGRGHCYAACRCDGTRKTIPGWSYSWVVGVWWGTSSWTAPVDVCRLAPDDDLVAVTATQIRALVGRLAAAGRCGTPWQPVPMAILDCGYPAPALADALAGVGVQLLVRLGDEGRRVFYADPPPRQSGQLGRPARHGARFKLADPATWPAPDQVHVVEDSGRYGRVEVRAWSGLHQRLQTRGHFTGRQRPAVVAGTVIRVSVERLPDGRAPHKTLWLWWSGPPGLLPDLDVVWRAYLRRFDAEHAFRFAKGTLGWTAARVRTPEQADRWTWLIVAAYTQLRLAVPLARDLRHPWERPPDPARPLSPHRVRRGFRHIRHQLGLPARGPKPARPGPGRPKGRCSGPARRYPVAKQADKADHLTKSKDPR